MVMRNRKNLVNRISGNTAQTNIRENNNQEIKTTTMELEHRK